MRVEAVEMRHVRLPLVAPFRTARSHQQHKEAIVVRVATDGADGWGECAAEAAPTYSSEFVASAWLTLRDHLAPALVGRDLDATGVGAALAFVRGHEMAKAALEMACLDAETRAQGISLAARLGAQAPSIEVGVVIDLCDSERELVAIVEQRLAEGYRRLKAKISPRHPLDTVALTQRVIAAHAPDTPLWVDANGSYTDAVDQLVALDRCGLGLIEQPLAPRAFTAHAELARRLVTPLCLDESIGEPADVELAAALGAASVVNIKPSRVGGVLPARAIADTCHRHGLRVWIGGMLDTGIARAANVALAAAVGDLPGDLSASRRYFARDLTEPFELDDRGHLAVPTAPGLGVQIDVDYLDHVTLASAVVARGSGQRRS